VTRATIPSPRPSGILPRLVVLAEVWRPREDEPGVTTSLPVLLCIAGRRDGDGWALVQVAEVGTGCDWPGVLSDGERVDVLARLEIEERLRADDARKVRVA
jgi:hypothetical protein